MFTEKRLELANSGITTSNRDIDEVTVYKYVHAKYRSCRMICTRYSHLIVLLHTRMLS